MTDAQINEYRKLVYQEREEIEREAQSLLNQDTASTIIGAYNDQYRLSGDERHWLNQFTALAQRAHTLDFVLETLNRVSRT